MSFGLHDKDWVDPDPEPIIKCGECEYWDPCPCNCGWGFCREINDFKGENDDCT